MNVKSFLDTNIIVYAFDQLAPKKAKIAQRLVADGAADKQAIISYQVVQEFINVALRGFRLSIVKSDLESFVLTALFPMMAISSSPSLVIEALRLHGQHQLAWYDALIVAAALQGGCKVLYSEDLQHGYRFGDLIVENPFR
ncbi:MAG: PIN domain-containing protein [Terriglobales bacterium]